MKKYLAIAIALLLAGFTGSSTITVTTTLSMPGSDVIHYIAPTGCDHNTGTTSSGGDSTLTCTGSAGQTGPWASPNHAMNCGDVIVASAGNYTNSKNDMRITSAVSSCPSTTGGIDGSGGINAAVILCGGADLGANGCVINCDAGSPCNANPGFGPPVGVSLAASNWAIEGFTVNGNSNALNLGFQAEGCSGSTVTVKTYFINNVAYNTGQAWLPQDCANFSAGADYVRIVGMIAENAVLFTGGGAGLCIGAIDVVSPGKFGASTTDVKYFIYNNYSYNNINTNCDTPTTQADGEDFLFDTLTNHSVAGHYVLANNIGFHAERQCINNFTGSVGASVVFREYNNTCFGNAQRGSEVGENYGVEIITPLDSGTFDIWNNIAQFPTATNTAGHPILALVTQGTATTSIGAQFRTGAENVFLSAATSCPATSCNSGSSPFSAGQFGSGTLGTNTYASPSFTNTTDLINNHLTVPTLTGFALTTQAMGWNAQTQTATSLSIISDLTPTGTCGSVACATKGFQPPSAGCLSSGDVFNDYPSDLKGLVVLQWDSANTRVIQVAGLANVPCGM